MKTLLSQDEDWNLGSPGSGKTYTMLGEIESLASPAPVPGWGIFPRIVHGTLEQMKAWRGDGVQSRKTVNDAIWEVSIQS